MNGITTAGIVPTTPVRLPRTIDWLYRRAASAGKSAAPQSPGGGWGMQPPAARLARDLDAAISAGGVQTPQPAQPAQGTAAAATGADAAEPPMSARMMASERAFGAAMMSLAFGPVPTLQNVALRLLINVGLGESVDQLLRISGDAPQQAAAGEGQGESATQTASQGSRPAPAAASARPGGPAAATPGSGAATAQAQGRLGQAAPTAAAPTAAAPTAAGPAAQLQTTPQSGGGAPLVSPAAYYAQRDHLSLADLRLIAGPEVTENDLKEALAQLPDSLKAAFDQEYDAYANQIAEAGAKIVMHWLDLITESQGNNLDGATLSLALPLARPGQALRTGADTATDTVTVPRGEDSIGRGYVLNVTRADRTDRYFVSTRTGALKKLDGTGPDNDWIKQNRDTVFSSIDDGPAAPGPSRYFLHPLGSGTLDRMGAWLVPALKADIEERRAFASTYKGRRDYAEPVMAWLPFRGTAAALARMDAFSGRNAFVRELAEMPPLHHMWVSAIKLSRDLEENAETGADPTVTTSPVSADAATSVAAPAAPAATDSAGRRRRSSGGGFDPSLRA